MILLYYTSRASALLPFSRPIPCRPYRTAKWRYMHGTVQLKPWHLRIWGLCTFTGKDAILSSIDLKGPIAGEGRFPRANSVLLSESREHTYSMFGRGKSVDRRNRRFLRALCECNTKRLCAGSLRLLLLSIATISLYSPNQRCRLLRDTAKSY